MIRIIDYQYYRNYLNSIQISDTREYFISSSKTYQTESTRAKQNMIHKIEHSILSRLFRPIQISNSQEYYITSNKKCQIASDMVMMCQWISFSDKLAN